VAITTLASVKIMADLFTRAETTDPTTASVGVLGDIWLNNDPSDANYGKTWELTAITGTAPALSYTWTLQTSDDAKINRMLARVEQDYLAIRGIPFMLKIDYEYDRATNRPWESDLYPTYTSYQSIYPTQSDQVAAEMVCYLLNYGQYQGRGEKSESIGDRSTTHDDKIFGYPRSIVGTIERYQSTK
jgi:hypothetical protein